MKNKSLESSETDKFEKIRVLIIEDNPVDMELLKAYLDKMGFRNVQQARNGGEGIFKIENSAKVGKTFHLLITDWKMPKKDGLALLKCLKAERTFKSIRIIMLTSESGRSQVRDALREGVDEFVLKPIDFEILRVKIERQTKKIIV